MSLSKLWSRGLIARVKNYTNPKGRSGFLKRYLFLHLHVQCVKQLRGHQNTVSSVLARNNSQQIVSGSHDGTLRVWDVGEGELSVLWMCLFIWFYSGDLWKY